MLVLEVPCKIVTMKRGANLQNQGIHTLCGQDRHRRRCAVPGGTGRRTRFDSFRTRWRSDQAAARASWSGKSGGFRVLVTFEAGVRAIFIHGFAKNEKDNIERDELDASKKLAPELLAYDEETIARAVTSGVLVEIVCDEKAIP
jgi:hypothetical protein